MLANATITALVGTIKPEISKAFYQDTLGLKFISEDTYAMVFEGKNARVRVSRVPAVAPAQYAVLAFQVDDIDESLAIAARHGVYPLRGVATYEDICKLTYRRGPSGILLMLAQALQPSAG